MPAPSEKGGKLILWGPLLVAATVAGVALGGFSVFYYLRYYNVETPRDTSPEPSEEFNKVVAGLDPDSTHVFSMCRHRVRSFIVVRPR